MEVSPTIGDSVHPNQMMKYARSLLFLTPAILLFFQSLPARSAPFQRARVSQVINKVSVIEPEKGSRPAKVNEQVGGRMAVRTGVKSRSELVFPDDTVTRLGSNTLFSFRKGSRDMKMEHGVMLLQAPKGAGGATISSGAVTAAITGTTILWEVPPPGTPEDERYVKVICVEANKDGVRFYFNNRKFDSIIVPQGHMLIVPPNIDSLLDVEPVPVNIRQLLRTSLLIRGMSMDRWVTPFALSVIDPAIFEQERKFAREELLPTNLVIDGGGTSVLIATNYRRNADGTLELERKPVMKAIPVSSPSPSMTPVPVEPVPTPLPTATPAQTPTPVPTPSKYGALASITSPDPYVVVGETSVITDPDIVTNGITDLGKIYRDAAQDGLLMTFVFGGTNQFDTWAGLNDLPDNQGVFLFSNLTLAGVPSIDTTDGPTDLILASNGDITSAAPGGNFTLSGLTSLSLIADGNVDLGPEINFIIPDAQERSLTIAGRGATSVVSLSNTVFASDLNLYVGAATDLFIDAFINTSYAELLAGGDVQFGTTVISTQILEVTALGDILFTPFDPTGGTGSSLGAQWIALNAGGTLKLDSSNFVFLDGDTFSGAGDTIEVMNDFRFFGEVDPKVNASLSAGGGGIQAFDEDTESEFDLIGFNSITSMGDIVAGDIDSQMLTTTNGGSVFADFVSGGTFNIAGDLFAAGVFVQNLTVGGMTDVEGLSVMTLVGGSVFAGTITSYTLGGDHTHTVDMLESPDGIQFDNPLSGSKGSSLTLNIPSVVFEDTKGAVGSASFNGGDGFPGVDQAGGDGGTFIVNASGDIGVNVPIEATTGAGSTTGTGPADPSGKGGVVSLNSTGGEITVNDRIEVSSNGLRTDPNHVSAEGGNIEIVSQVADSTATAINITNSAQLHALLSAASPGPGGMIVIRSSGGEIVAGAASIEATNGVVDIRNNGADGMIALNGTQIAADVVKVGALGANGVLRIEAGSQIDANSAIKLYGGLSAGRVEFVNEGTINLNAASTVDIAAKTVQVQQGTTVNSNAGTTRVSADQRNYNTDGFGDLNASELFIQQNANQAPSFD